MSLVMRGSAAALLCALFAGPAAAQASFPFWIGRAGVTPGNIAMCQRWLRGRGQRV